MVIIIGILAAIALPSFLNQAAKAKQSEAKSYIGAINRAQQTYRIENPSFAADFESLELGIPDDTESYAYVIAEGTPVQALANANAKDGASLRSYSGGVVVMAGNGQTVVASCETSEVSDTAPGVTFAPAATDSSLAALCPEGSESLQ